MRAEAQMLAQRLGDLATDGQHGIERRHWVLEHDGDLAPAQLT